MPLTRAIGVVLATAACARPEEGGDAPARADVRVDPPSVYFGLVQWGETGATEISLTNDGNATAQVTLVDPSDGLTIGDAGPFPIEPGATSVREIAWTPTTFDGFSTQLEVLGPDGPYTALSVTGGTVYPIADASFEPHDFGAVPLGCEPAVPLPVVNEGVGELILSATSEEGFSVRDELGQPLEAPLVIGPRSSVNLDVAFAPLATGATDAVLALTTNDPSLPLLELDLRGEGLANDRKTTEWIPGLEPLTIVVQVNQEVVGGDWTRLEPFLTTFFDTLNAAGSHYRVAFVVEQGAQVEGDLAYIDESFATAEAVAAASAMLAATTGGDNDAGLATCLEVVLSSDWAVGGTALPHSKLNAVVMNTDAEQSGGNASYYVEHLREAWGSYNFAVHGIAGDVPGGCKEAGLRAAASPLLKEATVATGGVFLSICDPDWSTTAEAIATACAAWRGYYLPNSAASNGFDVYVDDVLQPSGWSYDRAANAIVFDNASRPPDGAVVRAEYYVGDVCE